MASFAEQGARRYGELTNCDLPLEAAEAQMKWLAKNLKNDLKPDIILWTGDSVSHDLVSLNKDTVFESIDILTQII